MGPVRASGVLPASSASTRYERDQTISNITRHEGGPHADTPKPAGPRSRASRHPLPSWTGGARPVSQTRAVGRRASAQDGTFTEADGRLALDHVVGEVGRPR